ncbi:MAG TPA: deoxyribonuclease IV [Abditibacteriaceae bacterium]|jgi:deoxyribonuclease-4
MPLGAHLPTSKGFESALRQAQLLGCDCLQVFSKSPRQWNAPPLDPQKCSAFRTAWQESGFGPLVVHDSYLINLAAPDDTVREKSIRVMIDEVHRADALGSDFLVTHCGAHLQKDCAADDTSGVDAGLGRLGASLQQVLDATPEARVRIALENTAAQGTCLGGPFEHLARVLETVGSERLCVCFDTCHALAAGHDVASQDGLATVLQQFEATVGWKHLALIHLNDSKGLLGRHLDRHEHIGQGEIGRDGMRRIVNHPRLQELPMILETPDTETMLETNLNTVRELQGKSSEGATGAAQPAQSEGATGAAQPAQQEVVSQASVAAKPGQASDNAAPVAKRSKSTKSSTRRSTGREHEDASFV